MPVASLLVISVLLVLAVRGLQKTLPKVHNRLVRVVTITQGAMAGLALALPTAAVLNLFVGLQRGTFYNLMILAMCLGFLGVITGALCGLLYGGMVLTSEPRINDEGVVPSAPTGPGTTRSPIAAPPESPEKPRSGQEGDAVPSTFGAFLAQAERPQDFKHPGGDG